MTSKTWISWNARISPLYKRSCLYEGSAALPGLAGSTAACCSEACLGRSEGQTINDVQDMDITECPDIIAVQAQLLVYSLGSASRSGCLQWDLIITRHVSGDLQGALAKEYIQMKDPTFTRLADWHCSEATLSPGICCCYVTA